MNTTKTPAVEKTRSGLFIRRDVGVGLLVHSPYTGLTYAVHPTDSLSVSRWLNSPESKPPAECYRVSLGAGWATALADARHPTPHLLPMQTVWSVLPLPKAPILINWFLTGRCPLACAYCYAEDLMRNEQLEPTTEGIANQAESILKLNPLVVVLTGGDPLFSPHLEQAIERLSGRVGIILDTSGYTLTRKHVELFKRHNVAVRISFDSERPKVNQAQRPIYSGYPKLVRIGQPSACAAVDALCKCLDAELSVTVQTVATKKTANDLVFLGNKLYRMGVRSWRVFKVAPSKARFAGYKKLVGAFTDSGKRITGKRARGPYDFVFHEIRSAYSTKWKQQMAVQITHNDTPNAVVLVGPDGRFYTESNLTLGKTLIDESHPTSPRLSAIRTTVDMMAHAERYLNLTAPTKD